jgi:CheY-like chemotaxis protein
MISMAAGASWHSPPGVLLVEDNPVNQLVAQALLRRRRGMSGDGAQALQRPNEAGSTPC